MFTGFLGLPEGARGEGWIGGELGWVSHLWRRTQPPSNLPTSAITARLWTWKRAIVEHLAGLRLTLHEGSAQMAPVAAGIPWLGFLIYPAHRRVKARKLVQGTLRLAERFDAWRAGRISFADFNTSVQGWINPIRYANSWGLRDQVLDRFVWRPGAYGERRGDGPCG